MAGGQLADTVDEVWVRGQVAGVPATWKGSTWEPGRNAYSSGLVKFSVSDHQLSPFFSPECIAPWAFNLSSTAQATVENWLQASTEIFRKLLDLVIAG